MRVDPDLVYLHGDGVLGLRTMPAGSVDLILSDPPSGETRAPFDVAPDLSLLSEGIWRVLRPGGVAVLMASCFDFAKALSDDVAHFSYERIWHKGRASGFLNAGKRPLKAHHFILIFQKTQGTFNPQRTTGHEPIHANSGQGGHGANYNPPSTDDPTVTRARAGATDRHPTSVIRTKTVGTTCGSRRHPQQLPPELLEELVLTYSNPGDLVVDPFAGSGSTGEAARTHGRRFIGWEIDASNAERARPALLV